MATITGATNEKIYNIPRWRGLNEHPDGDTRLKLGEASEMVNWKITRDGNLKRRPGTEEVVVFPKDYRLKVADEVSTLSFDSDITIEYYRYAELDYQTGEIVLRNAPTVQNGVLIDPGQLSGDTLVLSAQQWSEDSGVITGEPGGAATAPISYFKRFFTFPNDYYALLDGQLVRFQDGDVSGDGPYVLTCRAVTVEEPEPQKIAGMWAGMYNGRNVMLAAFDGCIYSLYNETAGSYTAKPLGYIKTDKGVSFFSFGGGLYILNGYEYYFYDGIAIQEVEGYRPLVAIAISPLVIVDGVPSEASESGELTSEYVNRLNGKRRVWISPNGSGRIFQMPEKNLKSVDWVKFLGDDSIVDRSLYTVDLVLGRVTFTTPPADTVNSFEIAYSVEATLRSDVTKNLFAEYYSGATDTRVFLYGDGTNRIIYSGLDYNGQPRADYFPDTYEARIGDTNTAVTSLVRHYGDLVCYKENSCWSAKYNLITLETGDVIPGLYVTPVNKDKGNLAPGQVRLVDNNPVTVSGKELYHWINSSYYSSEISRDERQARRISDRIQKSIRDLDLRNAVMWDDNDAQEFYLSEGGVTLVWNYAADAWYRYEGLDVACMCNFLGELYIGTSDGRILRLTYDVPGDLGEPITARWVSGAMDFSADFSRKYSSMLWIGLKPEEGTSVNVCVETDRKNTFREKIVSSEKAKIPNQPFMVKTKIKAKKFVYYRLVLECDELQPAVTVTAADFRVRMTGYTK